MVGIYFLSGGTNVFDVCSNCGQYAENKPVDQSGPFVVCQRCGYKYPFLQLPLFIIGGVSGTGKTTICLELVSRFTECIVLDSDLLWRAAFVDPENNHEGFRSTWLEIAANISQSRRPVALFGIADPERYEALPTRHYFSVIHYLLYTCSDEILIQRLQARPEWRQSHTTTFIDTMITYNQHLLTTARTTQFPMTILDTGGITIQETNDYTKNWIRQRLAPTYSSHHSLFPE